MEEKLWAVLRSLWADQPIRIWRREVIKVDSSGSQLISKERAETPAKMAIYHSDELEEIYGSDWADTVLNIDEFQPEKIFIHTARLTEVVGCSESYARQWLRNFSDAGLLEVYGEGLTIKGTPSKLYYIPELSPEKELELLVTMSSADTPIVAPEEESEFLRFKNFVVEFDWPNKQLDSESAQAEHVARVLWHVSKQNPELKEDGKLERLLRGNLGFGQAFKDRAEEAKVREQTVRAACARDDNGVTKKISEFKEEGRALIEKWNSKRSKA